jgi:hypothetical protein
LRRFRQVKWIQDSTYIVIHLSHTMTSAISDRRERALPVGRAVRFLIGVALIVDVIPVFWEVSARFLFGTALIVLGLLAVCSLIHVLASRRLLGVNSWLGATLANGLLVAVYIAGCAGWLLLRGEGQVAAVTFLGVSLLFAAARGDGGCEVMSIPSALFGGHARMPCLVFSPIDWLERKLRRSPNNSHLE